MSNTSDTIFALSTGVGRSAIAIIRISGRRSLQILKRFCKRDDFPERQAIYSNIYDINGVLIDRGIVLFFGSPRSFTGEDMAEFHVTGGTAIANSLSDAFSGFSETRPAEAGEFARRAFENGKMDLVQVEGLAAIIDADTSAQARHSALMAFGRVSQQCEAARSQLVEASALMEGLLDFSDIEDPEATSMRSVQIALERARATLNSLIDHTHVTERLRSGFTVAIVGKPNAGKSTLINYILQRDAAIVSEIPGTTRDYLEFFVDLKGFPTVFIDTAGYRTTSEPIERLGIDRSRERIRAVDLVVWLSETAHIDDNFLPPGVPVIKVRSKIDLAQSASISSDVLSLSTLERFGTEALLDKIAAEAGVFFRESGEARLGTERQRNAVSRSIAAIDRALSGLGAAEELIAEEIRSALTSLGRVTGRVDVEDVLDEVFSRLCVGK